MKQLEQVAFLSIFLSACSSSDCNDRPTPDEVLARYGHEQARVHEMRAAQAAIRAPHVQLGWVTVTGAMNAVPIQDRIEQELRRIEQCYLAHRPPDDQPYRLTLRIEIDAAGHARATEAYGVVQTARDCVADVVESIDFPPTRDGQPGTATCPFKFAADPCSLDRSVGF